MDINAYFDELKTMVATELGLADAGDELLKLKDDNVQLVINQNFNAGVPVEELCDIVCDMIGDAPLETPVENPLSGDRSMNRMEGRIMNFNEFLNERRND